MAAQLQEAGAAVLHVGEDALPGVGYRQVSELPELVPSVEGCLETICAGLGWDEASLNNNDCENFFSLIAQQLGYKPRLIEFEARAQLIDYALREEFDPDRVYQILQSRRYACSHAPS